MNSEGFDICECGDYRKDHADRWRECNVCTDNDGMNGRKCLMFRLFEHCRVRWEVAR